MISDDANITHQILQAASTSMNWCQAPVSWQGFALSFCVFCSKNSSYLVGMVDACDALTAMRTFPRCCTSQLVVTSLHLVYCGAHLSRSNAKPTEGCCDAVGIKSLVRTAMHHTLHPASVKHSQP